MTEHAKLAPSAAHRWMRCPASIRLEADFPDTTSVYAEEGTRAHKAAEKYLKFALWPDGTEAEMKGYVGDFSAYVDAVAESVGATERIIEERLDLAGWVPDCFGTADVVLLGGDEAAIIDLKYGKGVRVDAEDNEQLMVYALGVLDAYEFAYDFETVRMCIHQPRLKHISESVMTVEDLRKWGEQELIPAAQATKNLNADPVPGEKQCRFCKAAGSCTKLTRKALEIVSDYDAELLDDDKLAEVLGTGNLVSTWLKATNMEALNRLKEGRKLPGWKLVRKQSNRRWIDEKEAEAVLKTKLLVREIYPPKIISPAAAEKALKKRNAGIIEGLWHRLPGDLTFTDINDKREAVEMNVTEGFNDENEKED